MRMLQADHENVEKFKKELEELSCDYSLISSHDVYLFFNKSWVEPGIVGLRLLTTKTKCKKKNKT